MSSLTANRFRHVARRLREAPLRVVAARARRVALGYAWWPACALRRAGGAQLARAPRFGGAFAAMGAAVRAEVSRAAREDVIYSASLATRVRTLLGPRRIPCLGYGDVAVPRGAAWRTDAVTGYAWPDRAFPFVNFLTHGADADVKVPWELSRLQWLVWLAEAVAADTPEAPDALAALEQTLDDWRAHNPLGYGPNWTVAMEVAIRAVNLGLAAALAWPSLADSTRAVVRATLAEHLRYLRAFPERSDYEGNHYLLNVTGLVFLEGVVFGDAQAHRLAERPWFAELDAQFATDGLHVEHAPLYHRLCVEALLWTLAFARRAGVAVPPDAAPLAARAWNAARLLEQPGELSPDGELPVLGDCDSGQVVTFGPPSRGLEYVRQLLGRAGGGAALLQAVAGGALIPAEDSREAVAGEPSTAVVGPFHRLAAHPFDLVVRAGPHGLFGLASHDHDDNAAPWVRFAGADFLVEAGCYAYTRSAAERLVDIASSSHNTVTVGENLRFVPRAGSISPNVARAPIATARPARTAEAARLHLALAWDDAAAGRVRHERTITMRGGREPVLEIEDVLVFERPTSAVVRWHLAPCWTADVAGATARLSHGCGAAIVVEATIATDRPDRPLLVEPYRHSPAYGRREEAARLVLATSRATSHRVVSTFAAAGRTLNAPSGAATVRPARAGT
jgi:hypothetical protein